MSQYKSVNQFTTEHFEQWDEDDIAALADFLAAQTNYRLLAEVGESDYDYHLLKKESSQSTSGSNTVFPDTSVDLPEAPRGTPLRDQD
jgi:hypothetical protein